MAECFRHGRTADHDFYSVPNSSLFGSIHNIPHDPHGRCEKCRTHDDLTVLINRRLDECFRCHVYAQVNDIKALPFQHNPDQVLADVVQIPFYGTDADPAADFGLALREQRLQDGYALIHRPGGNQDFRYKDFIVLEFHPDDIETCEQSLFKDLLCGNPLVDGLLHQFFDNFRSSCLDFRGNLL